MRSAIGVLLPIVKETMQCRRTSSAAARNCAAHWVLLGFAIFAGGEVTPGMFVPVLVALAQLGVHHIRRNNEDAAIVGRIWVGKPNEHREVGPRVAFEQRCPVRAAPRPLCSRRSVSRRFYGKSDLSRAPHRQEVYGARIHHTSSIDIAAVHPRTNNRAWTTSSPAAPISCAMQFKTAKIIVRAQAPKPNLVALRPAGIRRVAGAARRSPRWCGRAPPTPVLRPPAVCSWAIGGPIGRELSK